MTPLLTRWSAHLKRTRARVAAGRQPFLWHLRTGWPRCLPQRRCSSPAEEFSRTGDGSGRGQPRLAVSPPKHWFRRCRSCRPPVTRQRTSTPVHLACTTLRRGRFWAGLRARAARWARLSTRQGRRLGLLEEAVAQRWRNVCCGHGGRALREKPAGGHNRLAAGREVCNRLCMVKQWGRGGQAGLQLVVSTAVQGRGLKTVHVSHGAVPAKAPSSQAIPPAAHGAVARQAVQAAATERL